MVYSMMLKIGFTCVLDPRRKTEGVLVSLFGGGLVTVACGLVEIPVMLSVCSFCNRTRNWFHFGEDGV